MKTSEILEMTGEHPLEPISKKRKSHVITPGYFVIDELEKAVKHLHQTPHLSRDDRKHIAKLAQEIIDIIIHEN